MADDAIAAANAALAALQTGQTLPAASMIAAQPAAQATLPAPGTRLAGTIIKENGSFGFIKQDNGEADMFVMPPGCVGFSGLIPPLGTRVSYEVASDPGTGRLRAENVMPAEGAQAVSPAQRRGTFSSQKGSFGFIKQDNGEPDMFVMSGGCTGFGGLFPNPGTRVVYEVVTDRKTGRPRAENVHPEDGQALQAAPVAATDQALQALLAPQPQPQPQPVQVVQVAQPQPVQVMQVPGQPQPVQVVQAPQQQIVQVIDPATGLAQQHVVQVPAPQQQIVQVIDPATGLAQQQVVQVPAPQQQIVQVIDPATGLAQQQVVQVQAPQQQIVQVIDPATGLQVQVPIQVQPQSQPLQLQLAQPALTPAPAVGCDVPAAQHVLQDMLNQMLDHLHTQKQQNLGSQLAVAAPAPTVVAAPTAYPAPITVPSVVVAPPPAPVVVTPPAAPVVVAPPAPAVAVASPARDATPGLTLSGEVTLGEGSGVVISNKGGFGFIKPDQGGTDMFVLAGGCPGFGHVLPPIGTRVVYKIVTDPKNGKPRASDVFPESANDVAPILANQAVAALGTPGTDKSGIFAIQKGNFGFIKQDSGEPDMFVMSGGCTGFGGAFPPAGTRVLFEVVQDKKTGRPRAENVRPADAAPMAIAYEAVPAAAFPADARAQPY